MHFNSSFISFTRLFSYMDFNTFMKVKEDYHNPLKVRSKCGYSNQKGTL